ncbi:hypothetical protein ACP4OV_029427 [Aristida adscensionis]
MAPAELSPYLLILAAVPLVILASRWRTMLPGARPRLAPGPWAPPVIGHLHYFAGGGGAPLHRALADLARRHGPLMTLWLGRLPVVVASSPEAAREVTRAHDGELASRPAAPMLRLLFRGAEGVTFAPHGDGWRRLRRLCAAELLSARRVRASRAVREDELGRLLRAVASDASAAPAPAAVNLTRRASAFVFDSAARAIVGGGSEHREDSLRRLQEGLAALPAFTLLDLFPSSRLAMLVSGVPRMIERRRRAMRACVPDFDALIDPIIEEHQQRAAAGVVAGEDDEDLLDVLLRLQDDKDSPYPLTILDIKSVIMDMFSAGSETSSAAIQWAMVELMCNPAAMQRAQAEVRGALAGDGRVTEDGLAGLHYLRLVIKETLRLHPPAPLLLPRECHAACTVLGHGVPRGAMVLVNAWAAGPDAARWDSPEEFAPGRFEGGGRWDFKGTEPEYIPFGAGRRVCPGAAFAMAHVELALAALLLHFDWAAAGEVDAREAAAGITAPPLSELVLVAVPRVPVPM